MHSSFISRSQKHLSQAKAKSQSQDHGLFCDKHIFGRVQISKTDLEPKQHGSVPCLKYVFQVRIRSFVRGVPLGAFVSVDRSNDNGAIIFSLALKILLVSFEVDEHARICSLSLLY